MGSLKLTTASSGSVILSPANTASDVTITVPAVTGTMLTNKTAGTVLQVVNATYGTTTSNSTTTYADTGLTATITPTSASSKILIMINQQVSKETGSIDTSMMLKIQKNGSDLATLGHYIGWNSTNQYGGRATFGWQYLDSPATTSALTYKTQFAVETGISGQVRVQYDGSVSTITLMEIAA